ncbi:DNA repair protein-like protein Rad7 [Aulographum hederae CBS 113979]|uniref:DNA repair protein-like protein Rad7 n=1 Tax=Aulographum hederae CBS 113979 TaxID=1176131 RepID=A0A6G1H7H5_9PEZI|nr:DNA repair protein-like protein Rad7 [Aulographum hederae CBS 113979]
MSGRRTGGRNIRGPHSALTDFLAANNISAAQIRADYNDRVRQAAQQNGTTNGDGTNAPEVQAEGEEVTAPAAAPAPEEPEEDEFPVVDTSRKRKRKSDGKAKEKAKKKAKKVKKGGSHDDSDFDIDRDMYKKAKKLPGQMENCEICEKRFTVTPYSKTGPDGGLLCSPCGREIAKDAKKEQKPKPNQGRKRRKAESDRLDHRVNRGTRSLVETCIDVVAKHHADVDGLGELPRSLLNKLSMIFSKKRVLNPKTLRMFLKSGLDGLELHDCANLEAEDYKLMFATIPLGESFVLKNAGQFKNETMDYMAQKSKKLQHLKLYAANLVSDKSWCNFFGLRGENLKSLQLEWMDDSFSDDTIKYMTETCPNLSRLKLKHCRKVTASSIPQIATLSNLQHLSLELTCDLPCERFIDLVSKIGANLSTLSLARFSGTDDEGLNGANDLFLEAIHNNCNKLQKLRLSYNDACSDAGFAFLFSEDWKNPPMLVVDLSSTRDIDNANPTGPEEAIGLASEGFKALMKHSGSKLRNLNISSCRHIPHKAFMDVFDPSSGAEYPELRNIDLSFCGAVDTVTVAGIFKTCPKLERLVAFGCFGVEGVVVPSGVLLIGAPKAQDEIVQVGMGGVSVDMALGGMLEKSQE